MFLMRVKDPAARLGDIVQRARNLSI